MQFLRLNSVNAHPKTKNLTNEPTKEQQPLHINQALQLYGFYHKKKKKKKKKKKSRIGARLACA
jgi:hypothetical protein